MESVVDEFCERMREADCIIYGMFNVKTTTTKKGEKKRS